MRPGRGGYEIRYKEPEEGRKYVIGVDSGESIRAGDLNGRNEDPCGCVEVWEEDRGSARAPQPVLQPSV